MAHGIQCECGETFDSLEEFEDHMEERENEQVYQQVLEIIDDISNTDLKAIQESRHVDWATWHYVESEWDIEFKEENRYKIARKLLQQIMEQEVGYHRAGLYDED